MEIKIVELPVYYASYFVNNDESGLDETDYPIIEEIEKTLKELNLGFCVYVSEETNFKQFNGIGYDVAEYTFVVLKK